MHALFDRGFLTLDDDFKIIEAKSVEPLPEQLRQMLPANRTALVPDDQRLQPHRAFLEFHRRTIFKDKLSA